MNYANDDLGLWLRSRCNLKPKADWHQSVPAPAEVYPGHLVNFIISDCSAQVSRSFGQLYNVLESFGKGFGYSEI